MPSSREEGSSHSTEGNVTMEGRSLFPQNKSKSAITSKPQMNSPNVQTKEKVVLLHNWLLLLTEFILI